MTNAQIKTVMFHVAYDCEMLDEVKAAHSCADIDKFVQGGCFLVYYDSVRKFLQELYDETDEEAERYSDEQVWRQYKHVLTIGIQNGLKKLAQYGLE